MKSFIAVLALVALAQAGPHAAKGRKTVIPVANAPVPPFGQKIAGGQLATRGQFPFIGWMVNDGGGACGATLLNQEWVLTAGHCVEGSSTFDLYFGALNPYDGSDTDRVDVHSSQATIHPNYNWPANDIAIVHLDSAIQFSDVVQPVSLPPRSQLGDSLVGRDAIAMGRGQDGDNDSSNDYALKWVPSTVISNEECGSRTGWDFITDSQICTIEGDGQSICAGDSGGAVTIEEGGKQIQIGIDAFWDGNCPSSGPSGFTRVVAYLDWITEITGISTP